jgi:riboflavin kinase/FMN adenylyltransferase
MEFIHGLHNLRPEHRGCAVTIGNFDGVHLGHQAMLERLRAHAARLAVPATVLTFEPSPREYFDSTGAPARLSTLREKLALLARHGVDRCIVLRFDARLQQLGAAAFMDLLEQRLGARAVVVGHDFRFAHRGEADVTVLRVAGPARGFEIEVLDPVQVEGERVSSTLVRAALAAGGLEHAQRLLGRRYSMCGRVVAGDRLGRKLGFATANIRLGRKVSPLRGIFAVRVYGAGDGAGAHPRDAVASVGTRPTLGEGLEWLLEIHIFDFGADLYGRRLEVQFVAFLRAERKFAALEAMVAQMQRDAAQARSLLS